MFAATGLFLLALGVSYGAYWLFTHPTDGRRRVFAISLSVLAVACFGVATAFPLFMGASPSLSRPSTTAQLDFASPRIR